VPLYVALDRGYFKDEGLDVELIPMADLSQAIQQVALSQVAFQVALPDPVIFNALDRGVEVKILASSTINRPVDAPAVLQVRQDLIDSGKYKGPSDLKAPTSAWELSPRSSTSSAFSSVVDWAWRTSRSPTSAPPTP
jgi:NitT/TauT family transport system substrate-binding protein